MDPLAHMGGVRPTYTWQNATLSNMSDCTGTCQNGHPNMENLSYFDCLMMDPNLTGCNITEWPVFLLPEVNEYTVPIFGYVTPFLVVFTLLTNMLVCVVLMKKNMRSPTNALLGAMAVSDMLTGVWAMPCYIHFFALGHYQEWMPYSWCFAYNVFSEYIPTIIHTASIWLTVALAVQRYIYVCHSIKAKQWCTMGNAIKVVIGTFIAAFISQFCRFFESEFKPVTLQKRLDPNQEMEACISKFTPFVERYQDYYFNVYFWFRVIFIHIVPCVTLMVLNALLINAMRAAQRRREQLLMQNRKSECRRLKESTCTTLMLVAVVGLFLLVEFPQAIFLTIMIIDNSFSTDVEILDEYTRNVASLFINLIIMLSYPINFFIYCGMSRQFRDTFKRLFIPNASNPDTEHSQYQSLPVENGNGNAVTNNGKTAETAI